MYLITVTHGGINTVIHEPGTSDVKVDGAQISREVNAFDSLEFDIYPDNPGWGELEPFATTVNVTNTKAGKTVFEGRVIQHVPHMDDDGTIYRSITCENVMGYLCDSLQIYAEEQHYADAGDKSGLQIYIEKLLQRHNECVEDYKKIYPGTITLRTFDTSGGVSKGISRGSTWDNLNDKLIGSFGGEMRVRRADDGLLYLDYAEQLGETRATRIAVAWNMSDAEREIDPDAVITRLYPYGAKISVEEPDGQGGTTEKETEERIGIESVNDGKPYIDDTVAIEKYGIVEGYQEWDDVTLPANLLTKAREWLGQNNAMPVSHSISAYDLSLLGLDIDSFELFDSYRCYNPLIDLDEILEIVKQTIDINEPENSSFDMGETSFRLSQDLTQTATKGDVQIVQSQTNTAITNVNNRVTSTQAQLEVASDRITQQVTENVQQTITTTVDTAVEEATKDYEQTVQDAKDAAQAAQQQAEQAATNAQTAAQTAEQARQDAQAAQSAASDATQAAAEAAGIAEGKGDVFFQNTEPPEQYQKSNTLWIDTTDGKNTPKRWDGEKWSSVQDQAAIDAANTAAQAATTAQQAQIDATNAASNANKAAQDAATAQENAQKAQEALENLQIGVTNIWTNSTFTANLDSYTTLAEDTGTIEVVTDGHNNHPGLKITRADYTGTDPAGVEQVDGPLIHSYEEGDSFTLSAWVRIDTAPDADASIFVSGSAGDMPALTIPKDAEIGAWKRYITTFTADAAGTFETTWVTLPGNGVITVSEIKLEGGTMASDWSPAPQDVDSSIEQQTGQVIDMVGELQNDVTSTREDLNDAITENADKVDQLTQTVTETTQRVTNLEQTAEGWSFNFNSLTETVTQLGDTVSTNFAETLKYIKFIDGEIWLGKDPEPGEDDFKVRIGNQRISFLQNNIEVAYISDNQLYITNAKVTTRLDVAQFAFVPRTNGNMTLRWFGA